MNRRTFLSKAVGGTAGAAVLGTAYGLFEAKWAHVVSERIEVPGIPEAFRGLRIGLLTDLHHGPWTGLGYIRDVVKMANELKPDLFLLGGDYCHNGPEFIEPCIDALAALQAPMGICAVMGNHDNYQGAQVTRNAFEKCGIRGFNNEGAWLKKDGQRLWLGGVDDYTTGTPQLAPALKGVKPDERCLLLCHNPEFAATMTDPRVGLAICGHTHGGQIDFPIFGPPIMHSYAERKFLHGLARTDTSLVYTSRGLGTVTPPIRFNCRPEINLIELG